jgi:16S rRNA (guanine966-N2)-methyltransferase
LAGTLKGKILRYPKTGIRPSSEMIRGAIFNIIGDRIISANVADFFCGAGALGIEALSRGAKSVYFFEKSKLAVKFLMANLRNLNGVKVIHGNVFKKIKTIKDTKFDIIIADPPYQKSMVDSFIQNIITNQILAQSGLIILQHHKKELATLSKDLSIVQQKRHGETLITMIRRKE